MINTTEADPVPPVDAGLSVIVEVIRTTELGEGGAAVGDGTKVLGGATIEGGEEEETMGGGAEKELVRICEVGERSEVVISDTK